MVHEVNSHCIALRPALPMGYGYIVDPDVIQLKVQVKHKTVLVHHWASLTNDLPQHTAADKPPPPSYQEIFRTFTSQTSHSICLRLQALYRPNFFQGFYLNLHRSRVPSQRLLNMLAQG